MAISPESMCNLASAFVLFSTVTLPGLKPCLRVNSQSSALATWSYVPVGSNAGNKCRMLIRSSMEKFMSDGRNIELVGISRHHPAFLNRQIIVLLLGLGVKDTVFKDLQVLISCLQTSKQEMVHSKEIVGGQCSSFVQNKYCCLKLLTQIFVILAMTRCF